MDVIVLSLASSPGCTGQRVPVLACRDALRAGGDVTVETVAAESDEEIDATVDALGVPAAGPADGQAAASAIASKPGKSQNRNSPPIRPGKSRGGSSPPNRPAQSRDHTPRGRTTGSPEAPTRRLVVAATTDGELRAVVRRMVRRYAPPASKRPDDLPVDRTVYDLPPVGVLPLDPKAPPELVARLGLPVTPEAVAAAVLTGEARRLDLFRTDSGSVTLHGALIGGADEHGQAVAWYGRVEVDDAVLSDGSEPLVACAIANATGYAAVDDLPLVAGTDPGDGQLDVGVAVPALHRGWLRRTLRVEVRRSQGRAVSITPRDEVPYLDDGVTGTLGRKRSWWIERSAWAVYTDKT